MEIAPGIKIIDLGLLIKKTLIIADLHIGYEEALNKQGVLVPRFQFRDVAQRLERMLKEAKPDVVVVNGDIKHEFGTISEQEWRETLKILDLLLKNSKRVVLVKGNHDTILGPIAKKRDVEVVDDCTIGDILIIHGHKEVKIPKNIKTIIISHEHPAVSIKEFPRAEKFKCFLKGKYRGKTLIVMPSLNLATEGTDILNEDLLSPFLHQKLDDFEVFVVGDRIYGFGKVRNILNEDGQS